MRLKKFTLFVAFMACSITIQATDKKQAIKYARHALALEESDKIVVFGTNL